MREIEREMMRKRVTAVGERERESELKEESEREEDSEGEKWRENMFNYSVPVFSIYGPFRAASRSYIYTYCRHRLLP